MNDRVQDLQQRVAHALAADYDVIRPLGSGGMATVFLAEERALRRMVAIKVLDPDLAASPVFRTRFQREAETAAQLQHPHIVPIYRVGEADGLAYFTMGYVEGESLAERMRREGRLPVTESLRLARQVGGALAAAHRRGIVHRDVKPQNVMLEAESGRALVTDFGIARVAVASGDPGPEDDDRLTELGMVMGTPRYMSPEQAAGERDLEPVADSYALGIMLYEMLTGDYPYDLRPGTSPIVAHLTHAVRDPSERIDDLPAGVAGLLDQLLEKNPERRMTAASFVAALDNPALTTGRPAARRPPPSRARRLLIGLGGLAVLAALVIGAVVMIRSRPAGPPHGVNPRHSLLIGFFANRTGDPGLGWLRLGGVELMTRPLVRWEDLTVVSPERLLDLARRVGMSEDATLSTGDVRTLAREAGVWTATIGTIVKLAQDRVEISVRVYDVASGSQIGTFTAEAAPDSTLPEAFEHLADRILDIAGAPRSALPDVDPPTTSLTAYQAYIEGLAARSRWDMESAIRHFRGAVDADPTFALAYYRLSAATAMAEIASPSPTWINLADSAYQYSTGRPPRERLLIGAFDAYVHAALDRADSLYRQVLAEDSTLADAWSGLGAVAQSRLTLVKDSRGRDSLPANLTLALNAYRRAQDLDRSNHLYYLQIANLLAYAGLEQNNMLPAFREPPKNIRGLQNRIPARTYSVLLIGDSLKTFPSESLTARFRQETIDSLRRRARQQAADVIDQWLAVAPDEGQAYMFQSVFRRLDRDYDGALTALEKAHQLGFALPIPYENLRLTTLLDGGRWSEAMAMADSMGAAGYSPDSLGSSSIFAAPYVNVRLAQGRLDEAATWYQPLLGAARALAGDAQLRGYFDVAVGLLPIRVAATTGTLRRPQLRAMAARLSSRMTRDSVPDDIAKSWASNIAFAAAVVGDTALFREWAARDTVDRSAERALAALEAGDRAGAGRGFADAPPRSQGNAWARARVAEALGKVDIALAQYGALDTLFTESSNGVDPEFPLLVRSWAHRAALYEAKGENARAAEYYRRFIDAWQKADPALQPEVERARQALGQLERIDRGDAPTSAPR